MKILVIGQPDSPHNVSFLYMLKQVYPTCCIHFFPSSPFALNPAIQSLSNHCYEYSNINLKNVYYQAYWDDLLAKPLSVHSGEPQQLKDIISEYEPDFIHVNALQDAGYLLSKELANGFVLVGDICCSSIPGNSPFIFSYNPLANDLFSAMEFIGSCPTA